MRVKVSKAAYLSISAFFFFFLIDLSVSFSATETRGSERNEPRLLEALLYYIKETRPLASTKAFGSESQSIPNE